MDCILLPVLAIIFDLYFDSICVLLVLRLMLAFSVEVKEFVVDLAFLLFLLFALASVSLLNILLSHGFVACFDFIASHLFSGVDSILDHLEFLSHFVVTEDLSFMLIKLSVEFEFVDVSRGFSSPLNKLLQKIDERIYD